jgi:hypothetical protein
VTPPHLTTIAAALMTAGGAIWAAAMTVRPADAIGGVICGLHQAAQPAAHCGWCYAALAMMAAGAGILSVAGARCLKPSLRR